MPEPVIDPKFARAAALVDKLWNDEKLGSGVRRAAKDLFPETSIIDDQLEPVVAPLREQNAALLKRLDEMQAAQEAERKAATEKLEKQRDEDYATRLDAARKRYGLTDESFDKMVARMKETGNYGDPEAAAAFILSQTPAPSSPGLTVGPQFLDFAGTRKSNERYKHLHMDPEGYFDDQVRQALDPATSRNYVADVMGEQYARIAFGQ
jgi:hypothetical protein